MTVGESEPVLGGVGGRVDSRRAVSACKGMDGNPHHMVTTDGNIPQPMGGPLRLSIAVPAPPLVVALRQDRKTRLVPISSHYHVPYFRREKLSRITA